MNELIKIERNESGEQLVSARDLHEFLEVKKDFSDWIKTYIKNDLYGFEDGIDYTTFRGNSTKSVPRPRIEYILKLDMAKELCMLSKVEKGKQARRYFIECEKALKETKPEFEIPKTYAAALLEAARLAEENDKLLLEKKENAPKVTFAESVMARNKSMKIETFAKLFKDNNIQMGRNKMLAFLRNNKFLMTNNCPYQEYINVGYFEIELVPKDNNTKARALITTTGQIFLANYLKKRYNGLEIIQKENL